MSSPLADQVILITGASVGIGAALADYLAQSYPGVRLILTARRAELLEAIAQRCRKQGADVLVVPTDLTQIDQVEALANTALAHFGRVDALVNNAGYGQMGPLELIPMSAVSTQFATNLIGPLSLTRCLIPAMREQGGGRIINISSLGGRLAFPFGGLYSATKFALEGLSDTLRMELAPFNIRVSVVEPGPVETEFIDVSQQRLQQAIANPETTPYRAAFTKFAALEKQLSQQMWSAERVAKVIVRALSDRNPRPRYIAATGGNILVFLMTKVMPTWMVDQFWQRFYGIDLVAKDWQGHRRKLGGVD